MMYLYTKIFKVLNKRARKAQVKFRGGASKMDATRNGATKSGKSRFSSPIPLIPAINSGTMGGIFSDLLKGTTSRKGSTMAATTATAWDTTNMITVPLSKKLHNYPKDHKYKVFLQKYLHIPTSASSAENDCLRSDSLITDNMVFLNSSSTNYDDPDDNDENVTENKTNSSKPTGAVINKNHRKCLIKSSTPDNTLTITDDIYNNNDHQCPPIEDSSRSGDKSPNPHLFSEKSEDYPVKSSTECSSVLHRVKQGFLFASSQGCPKHTPHHNFVLPIKFAGLGKSLTTFPIKSSRSCMVLRNPGYHYHMRGSVTRSAAIGEKLYFYHKTESPGSCYTLANQATVNSVISVKENEQGGCNDIKQMQSTPRRSCSFDIKKNDGDKNAPMKCHLVCKGGGITNFDGRIESVTHNGKLLVNSELKTCVEKISLGHSHTMGNLEAIPPTLDNLQNNSTKNKKTFSNNFMMINTNQSPIGLLDSSSSRDMLIPPFTTKEIIITTKYTATDDDLMQIVAVLDPSGVKNSPSHESKNLMHKGNQGTQDAEMFCNAPFIVTPTALSPNVTPTIKRCSFKEPLVFNSINENLDMVVNQEDQIKFVKNRHSAYDLNAHSTILEATNSKLSTSSFGSMHLPQNDVLTAQPTSFDQCNFDNLHDDKNNILGRIKYLFRLSSSTSSYTLGTNRKLNQGRDKRANSFTRGSIASKYYKKENNNVPRCSSAFPIQDSLNHVLRNNNAPKAESFINVKNVTKSNTLPHSFLENHSPVPYPITKKKGGVAIKRHFSEDINQTRRRHQVDDLVKGAQKNVDILKEPSRDKTIQVTISPALLDGFRAGKKVVKMEAPPHQPKVSPDTGRRFKTLQSMKSFRISRKSRRTLADLDVRLTDSGGGLCVGGETGPGAGTGYVTNLMKRRSYSKKKEKMASKEKKATQTLAIVLFVFLISWVPFFTIQILNAICQKIDYDPCKPSIFAFTFTTWIGYVNSLMNPAIYTIFNIEFRKAFKKLLCCN